MTSIRSTLLATSVAVIASAAAQADEVRATIDAGVLVGESENGVERYLGVPFAQPPVGELRWAPPEPPEAWDGERDATAYELPCYQNTNEDGVTPNGGGVSGPSSEDCLYLNVYAPADADGDAPVMVWFYGGANYLGGAHLATYNGQSFAENGVVVVTTNYRLGYAGWYAHPAITAAAGEDAQLVSYGNMDQTEALRWVQRNIEAFGGDRENVTIFGQSAGGFGVYAQLASPSAEGLFHKAIVHSAGYTSGGRSLTEAELLGAEIATEWGLDGADATIEELRAVPIEQLAGATLGGVTDGTYFVEPWLTTFAFNRHHDVPFIVGGNSGEGTIWARDRWIAEHSASGAPAFQYHFSHVREGLDQDRGAAHSAELRFAWNTLREWSDNAENVAVANAMHPCWVAFAFYDGEGDIDCGNGVVWPAFTETDQPVLEFTTDGPVVHDAFRSDSEWTEALRQRRGR